MDGGTVCSCTDSASRVHMEEAITQQARMTSLSRGTGIRAASPQPYPPMDSYYKFENSTTEPAMLSVSYYKLEGCGFKKKMFFLHRRTGTEGSS